MPQPICITCVRCRGYLEVEAATDDRGAMDAASFALIRAAKTRGWLDREGDGWYCPDCAAQLVRPPATPNGAPKKA